MKPRWFSLGAISLFILVPFVAQAQSGTPKPANPPTGSQELKELDCQQFIIDKDGTKTEVHQKTFLLSPWDCAALFLGETVASQLDTKKDDRFLRESTFFSDLTKVFGSLQTPIGVGVAAGGESSTEEAESIEKAQKIEEESRKQTESVFLKLQDSTAQLLMLVRLYCIAAVDQPCNDQAYSDRKELRDKLITLALAGERMAAFTSAMATIKDRVIEMGIERDKCDKVRDEKEKLVCSRKLEEMKRSIEEDKRIAWGIAQGMPDIDFNGGERAKHKVKKKK